MRIAIDVRKIHDFGIGTYLRNLIRHIPNLDSVNEYTLLGYRRDEELLRSLSTRFRHSFVKARNYSLSEHLTIPFDILRPPSYRSPLNSRQRDRSPIR